MQNFCAQYIDFQKNAPSVFHVVAFCRELLSKAGFYSLDFFAKEWKLVSGKGYYLVHPSQKAIVAFIKGAESSNEVGFNIVAAHLDSPVLHLKLKPIDKVFDHYAQLYTQLHGGLIFRSWLDRPLQLAGMLYRYERRKDKIVFADSLPKIESKLVATSFPVGIIPDLAIHLDREKNKYGEINPETGLNPIISSSAQKGTDFIKQLFKILDPGKDETNGEWDGFELVLAPFANHELVGIDQSFIAGPRHDDLAMVFAGLKALTATKKDKVKKTALTAFFDSEETGSQTVGGAQSSFLRDCLERIQLADGSTNSAALAKSFVISADMAHALHPAYSDRHDSRHRPLLNAGMVLKMNSNDRYASSGYSATCFNALCKSCDVPLQPFIAKQDGGCGSTIGPTLASLLNCQVVDVGAAAWAMHSTCEIMGVKDLFYAKTVFAHFFAAGKE